MSTPVGSTSNYHKVVQDIRHDVDCVSLPSWMQKQHCSIDLMARVGTKIGMLFAQHTPTGHI
eukprot:364848-Chlamydomonas_euryale.AAC.18